MMGSFALLVTVVILGSASADKLFEMGPPQGAPGYSYSVPNLRAGSSIAAEERVVDPLAMLRMNIPGGGVPGEDFPILASVPDTGFSCTDQEYPGYYADDADEAGCQVFHICQFDGRQDSFLCPNGTIFNQQYFVCDWWFNVDCSSVEQFQRLNENIGKVDLNADGSLRSGSVALPEQSYAAPQMTDNRAGQSFVAPQLTDRAGQSYSAPQMTDRAGQSYSAPQMTDRAGQSYAPPQVTDRPVLRQLPSSSYTFPTH